MQAMQRTFRGDQGVLLEPDAGEDRLAAVFAARSVSQRCTWTKGDEIIAVHIKNGTITFSGNDYLLGNDITICPPGTLGTPSDALFFDSSGCSGRLKDLVAPRQYGTLNKILLKLDLTNTNQQFGTTGRFHCTKVS
jgi:hypothetical protein